MDEETLHSFCSAATLAIDLVDLDSQNRVSILIHKVPLHIVKSVCVCVWGGGLLSVQLGLLGQFFYETMNSQKYVKTLCVVSFSKIVQDLTP